MCHHGLSVKKTLLGLFIVLICASGRADDELKLAKTEERAIAYLTREVPSWTKSHQCFSCHNNAEAARALYYARKLGRKVGDDSLSETSRFLRDPARWDKNGTDGPFSDKLLARIEFTVALQSLHDSESNALEPLRIAAERLVIDQAKDGSWILDDADAIGSPATYGRPLASALVLSVLRDCRLERLTPTVVRGEEYLRRLPCENTLEASAVMLGLLNDTAESRAARKKAREYFSRARSPEGGWGPYSKSPVEVFDTALAVIVLNSDRAANPEHDAHIRSATSYLVASQNPDGSWPETTRPSGAVSYAQRLSTTGWATRAVLSVRARK